MTIVGSVDDRAANGDCTRTVSPRARADLSPRYRPAARDRAAGLSDLSATVARRPYRIRRLFVLSGHRIIGISDRRCGSRTIVPVDEDRKKCVNILGFFRSSRPSRYIRLRCWIVPEATGPM